ncbi:MAG: tyrosine-type recombinase/integrase [Chloroflexota bacterium]|nr:tyrosine-type recombinase/integrase [Chloroflexota bacterium]
MGKKKLNKKPRITTLPEAYDDFRLSRQAMNVSKGTLTFYADKLPPFIDWCAQKGITNAEDVSAGMVRAYIVFLRSKQQSDWTTHGAARAIRTLLRFCEQEGYIAKAPKLAMPKLPKTIKPAIPPQDILQLLDACLTARDRCVILVLLDTGARASEFVALNVGDIDPNTGDVSIFEGKGRKSRIVFLSARTRREIARHWREEGKPEAREPMWTNPNTGQRLTDSGLRQLLERLAIRAGVPHVNPHRFRHTFAITSLRNGVPIYLLARMMGHSTIDVLKAYLDIAVDDVREAHRKAGNIDSILK